MAYGNRKAQADKGSKGRRSQKGGDATFICLGDLTIPKSSSPEQEDIAEAALEEEMTVMAKVWFPDKAPEAQNGVTIYKGDRIMVKFKAYDKSPDFSYGKVMLVVDEN